MSRKVRFFLIFLLFLIATVAWILAQQSGDRPPGVRPENWIPLTKNSGIALKENSRISKVMHKKEGILLVKVDSVWQEVYLASGPGEIVPIAK